MAETVDLRSDTVTTPTDAMRRAMMDAPLGDDVLGDEPTVIELQRRCAELFGKAGACFVPSGTMANLSAIKAQTEPGDEILASPGSHILHYETAGVAAIAGCQVRAIDGERGQFDADQIDAMIRPNDHHAPRTRMVEIENTANRGGGSVWSLARVRAVSAKAREHGLRVHLDGARLWNACVASGTSPAEYAAEADTVSACFSKALGTPAGSIVVGDAETIHRVHRLRKMFGGAMRQAGVLAGAALHAIDHHIDRLVEDHVNARRLANGLSEIDGVTINPDSVETNIVYFDVDPGALAAPELCARLSDKSVRMLATGPATIRAVTHLQVDEAMIERAIAEVRSAIGAAQPA